MCRGPCMYSNTAVRGMGPCWGWREKVGGAYLVLSHVPCFIILRTFVRGHVGSRGRQYTASHARHRYCWEHGSVGRMHEFRSHCWLKVLLTLVPSRAGCATWGRCGVWWCGLWEPWVAWAWRAQSPARLRLRRVPPRCLLSRLRRWAGALVAHPRAHGAGPAGYG